MTSTTQQQVGLSGGPLGAVRILDLSRLVSGGHCSVVLADLGADIIKLERPTAGDELRGHDVSGFSPFFATYNRNKRSICVDLKTDAGRALLLRLVKTCDALLENFKPGTLERLGIGPSELHKVNPALVITRISGWGQTGPYANRPGFGTLAEAVSGFMARNGYADRPPVPAPTALADMVAGLYAATATVAAINHAQNNGEGQVVDVSLFEPLVSIMGPMPMLDRLGKAPLRGEGTRASSVKGVFLCQDNQWIAISAGTEGIVHKLFDVLELGHLLDDERYSTHQGRLDRQDEVNEWISEWVADRPQSEVLHQLQGKGVTVAPLYDTAAGRNDPHFRAREVFVEIPGGCTEPETVEMHNVVPRFSDTPARVVRPAPGLGEHTEEVLREFGLTANEIHDLTYNHVIGAK